MRKNAVFVCICVTQVSSHIVIDGVDCFTASLPALCLN